jgi:hypothetical protein
MAKEDLFEAAMVRCRFFFFTAFIVSTEESRIIDVTWTILNFRVVDSPFG